jgi:2-keto-4-pentenoate hydratase/2-oxohepta-3-ene-1,7-dioic acid hydratase in catechol pathway
MKLTTYVDAGRPRLAAVEDETLIDLNRAAAARARDRGAPLPEALADATVPADALAFLRAGDDALAAAREALAHAAALPAERARRQRLRLARTDVELLPPVPAPPKIVCVGRNYAEHAEETGLAISEIPILFARFAATLVADGAPVVRPAVSEQLDWEGELAVVIGKGGRHVPRRSALDHVAGYAIFNDVTVRDYQFRTTQYTAGKNFAASGPFGPCLVLKDEVPDPHALEISTYVGDERVQHGRTADMLFDVPTIVAHLSEFMPLEPGDVIATGTPSGVGFKRTPPRFLVPGDVVRVEIPGLGVLANPVVDEAALAG